MLELQNTKEVLTICTESDVIHTASCIKEQAQKLDSKGDLPGVVALLYALAQDLTIHQLK